MYKNKKILAVIPARGGSKGIPGKNLRLLNNVPLIVHTLKNLLSIKEIDKIVVSSDCDEILDVSKKYCEIIKRPENLANDATTLDPVIIHAHEVASKDDNYDYILTFQPTSPLLKKDTIVKGIHKIIDEYSDSLLTVVNDRYLNWTIKDKLPVPLYKNRVNRQKLPPNLRETGGIIGCKKDVLLTGSRIGKKISLLEVSFEESIDIDYYHDLVLVEHFLKKPNLAFIVTGNKKTGLGHVYRTLLLAKKLNFKPLFLCNVKDNLAIDKIKENNFELQSFNDFEELIHLLDSKKIDLVINDTLDTTVEYVKKTKCDKRVFVSFEDLGEGSKFADLSINALYESKNKENKLFGHEYVCLRDEFLLCDNFEVRKEVKNVLISFGGTDPNNLTKYVLEKLSSFKDLNIKVILGIGYSEEESLKYFKKNYSNITFLKDIKRMSSHMLESDIFITSNGRTTYEAASVGVPTISICQNQREIKHMFGELTGTILNLGLFSDLEQGKFIEKFNYLYNNYDARLNLSNKMKSLNLKKGADRVIKLILEKYEEKKNE